MPQFPSQKWSHRDPTPRSALRRAQSELCSKDGTQDRNGVASKSPMELGISRWHRFSVSLTERFSERWDKPSLFLAEFKNKIIQNNNNPPPLGADGVEGELCISQGQNCIQPSETPGVEQSGGQNRLEKAESGALIHAGSRRSELGLSAQHGVSLSAGSASGKGGCTDGMVQNGPWRMCS